MFTSARVTAACLTALLFATVPLVTANASGGSFATDMQAAAQARHVPLAVIEATAYVDSAWEWIPTAAADGGYGPMNVLPSQEALASSLSGQTAAQIQGNPAANLDAGAALLAHYHTSGTDLASWQPALTQTQGPQVADEIFAVMRTGVSRTTSTGETITLAPQSVSSTSTAGPMAPSSSGTATTTTTTDYPSATWIPADPSNYSVADRPHDYPVNMIIIHDIEGSYGSAIQLFQEPNYGASAHYVVGYQGEIAQMVREKDIAWHAGNWDYNTRSIGIEHEGYASCSTCYTTAEYNASAALAASICSRWGVPLDRNHVIGHYQVPDPNNPGLYGGVDHHTDPGPYWNWTYYMATAQADAAGLPSPPHMGPDPLATNGVTSATVTWQPAQSCTKPITGYTVVASPGGMTQNLPGTATSATFTGLQMGTAYTFSVTATDADGQDTLTSNPAVPGNCTAASVAASPASPQAAGTKVVFTASSSTCPNPQYQFWLRDLTSGGAWSIKQAFGAPNTWTLDTSGLPPDTFEVSVWANEQGGDTTTYQAYSEMNYWVGVGPCLDASLTPASQSQPIGSAVTLTASSSTCYAPRYAFWVQYLDGSWHLLQGFGGPSFTWSTAGLPAGQYTVHVWANTSGNGYDSVGSATVSLTDCTSAALNPSSISQPAGATLSLTASATGCSSPRFEFWAQYPNGSWNLLQGFGGPATLTWNTSGLAPGSYLVHVWAGTQGTGYSAIGSATVTLTPNVCASASLSPATQSGPAGSTLAFTASSSGCVNPRYAFWVQYPDSSWHLLQGFGGPTFNWSTAGLPTGSYTVHVWVNTQGNGYDAVGSAAATLTGCTAATLSPSSGSAPQGTTVSFTAGSSGCSSPRYAFWVQYPDSSWHLAQNFGGPSFDWITTGLVKGSYTIHVWVNTQGNGYDTIGSATYTLT